MSPDLVSPASLGVWEESWWTAGQSEGQAVLSWDRCVREGDSDDLSPPTLPSEVLLLPATPFCLLLFFLFFFLTEPRGILVPRPGIKPSSPHFHRIESVDSFFPPFKKFKDI